MDRYLSDYEKLLHEYERIESKLNSLFIQTDLSESARKKLEISSDLRFIIIYLVSARSKSSLA